ncbi:hypothetical protein [Pediococcus acidilactici]|uniref:hypothetical protein n=1 Tax=Pediococcus acidilactici TaxID=1254 RepID=UPI003CF5E99C
MINSQAIATDAWTELRQKQVVKADGKDAILPYKIALVVDQLTTDEVERQKITQAILEQLTQMASPLTVEQIRAVFKTILHDYQRDDLWEKYAEYRQADEAKWQAAIDRKIN